MPNSNVGFRIQVPKGFVEIYGGNGYSANFPHVEMVLRNVFRNDNELQKILYEWQGYPKGDRFYGFIKQIVVQTVENDGKTKITQIEPYWHNCSRKGLFGMVQTLDDDGTYKCTRVGNGKSYFKEIKPELPEGSRKFLTGFKGKIEKALMNVAQDSNGCERKVIRSIAGKMINILRRVR